VTLSDRKTGNAIAVLREVLEDPEAVYQASDDRLLALGNVLLALAAKVREELQERIK
jgi:hypothetical protein